MADICDLSESAIAGDSYVPSVLIPGPLQSAAAATDEVIQRVAMLCLATMDGASSATQSRGALFVSGGLMGSAILGAGIIRELLAAKGVARSSVYALLSNLAGSTMAGTSSAMQHLGPTLLTATGQVTSIAYAQAEVTTLCQGNMVGASKLMAAFFELVQVSGAVATSAVLGHREATQLLTSGGTVNGDAIGFLMAYEQAESAATMAASAMSLLLALDLHSDDLFADTLASDGHEVITGGAWTANTDALGMSRYGHRPFNSLAVLAGRLVMLADDGAYVRGGTDDAGTPIDGYVKTGLDRWGNASLFRPDKVYLSYTGLGARIEVGETSDGIEQTWGYDMARRTTPPTVVTHGRVEPGRGMRTQYARITIRNVDGGPLAVTDASLTTIKTSRNT